MVNEHTTEKDMAKVENPFELRQIKCTHTDIHMHTCIHSNRECHLHLLHNLIGHHFDGFLLNQFAAAVECVCVHVCVCVNQGENAVQQTTLKRLD